ncbi:MAG TPA: RNA polymerase sigma factor, partial [Planctomycetota bacterium]|nr:RNA polymerase sigma factor [Planctomycetota bacterium]
DLAALGTREAFEVLFHRHRNPVYQFIARQISDRPLAEDIFQTVFLKAFRALQSFRGSSEFRTWLFTIAANAVAEERRRPRPAVALPEEIEGPAPTGGGREAEDISHLIRRVIETLPERHRQLFLLVRFHRMRIAEAAQIVGFTPGSAKVTLFRIQEQLGSQLKSLGVLL